MHGDETYSTHVYYIVSMITTATIDSLMQALFFNTSLLKLVAHRDETWYALRITSFP